MTTRSIHTRTPVLALLLAATLTTFPAWAAPISDAADLAERNRQERAVCMTLQVQEDRTSCLEDAFGAYRAAKRHILNDVAPQYAQNALRRCDALKDDLRQGCLARMGGQGTTSGSVTGGGIYRELVTFEPAKIDSQTPPNAAAATDAPKQ